jgi:hypothetical protein
LGIERLCLGSPEDERRTAATRRELVGDQAVAERQRDRHGAPAGATLRLDVRSRLRVPGALDPDHALGETDVLPAERHELAATEPAVESRRPHRAVALRESSEQLGSLVGRGDPVTLAAHGGKLEARRRVDGDLAPRQRPAEDRSEGGDPVSNGRRVQAFGLHPVDERLDVGAPDVREPRAAEIGQDAIA